MIEKVKENIKREIKKSGRTSDQVCRSMKVNRKFISSMTDEVKLSKILMICNDIGCSPGDVLNNI